MSEQDDKAKAAAKAGAAGAEGDAGEGDGKEGGLLKTVSELRRENKAERAARANAETELLTIKDNQAKAEAARLAEANDFKTLYIKEQERANGLNTTLEKVAAERRRDVIRFKVQKEFPQLKDTYIEKLFPFDKVSISADGASLEGLAEALASFKTDYSELIGAGTGKSGEGAGSQGKQGGGESPAERLARELRERDTGSKKSGKDVLMDFRKRIGEKTAKVFG